MQKYLKIALASTLLGGAITFAQTRPSQFAEQMSTLGTADQKTAFETGQSLAGGDPEVVWPVLRNNWTNVFNPTSRQQILKAFSLVPNNPRLLDVLNLGMSDFDGEVRKWAVQYLRPIALRDFGDDPSSYPLWRTRTSGQLPEAVAAESVNRWAKRFGQSEDTMSLVHDALQTFRNYPSARKAAVDAGMLEVVAKWFDDAAFNSDRKLSQDVDQLVRALRPDEPYLRKHVLPLAVDRDRATAMRTTAILALGSPGNSWAVDPLLKILIDTIDNVHEQQIVQFAADSLAQIGEKRAIPTLIAVMDADHSKHFPYEVGFFGLQPLTGVEYDPTHTAGWWKDWWDEHHNDAEFPEDVRKLAIPIITAKK